MARRRAPVPKVSNDRRRSKLREDLAKFMTVTGRGRRLLWPEQMSAVTAAALPAQVLCYGPPESEDLGWVYQYVPVHP